ncbi:MAG: hypothetical protein K0S78_5545 [Thermomicrobiales bacterium]|jgi:hypothetical protein|nr:hypothetical protein [Thermomicrobiales bacterium]
MLSEAKHLGDACDGLWEARFCKCTCKSAYGLRTAKK